MRETATGVLTELDVGDQAPDFTVTGTSGRELQLTDTFRGGETVVILFRGHWCSICVEQLRTFSALNEGMRRFLDMDILPIAGDTVPELRFMEKTYDLQLELFSDPELSVAKTYTGIEDTEEHCKLKVPGGSRGHIPIPGTYIIDPDGIIRYKQVASDPNERTYGNFVRHFPQEHAYKERYAQEFFPGTYPNAFEPDADQ